MKSPAREGDSDPMTGSGTSTAVMPETVRGRTDKLPPYTPILWER